MFPKMAFLLYSRCIFPGLFQHFLPGCETKHQMWAQTPFLSRKQAEDRDLFSGGRKRGQETSVSFPGWPRIPGQPLPMQLSGERRESKQCQADSNTSGFQNALRCSLAGRHIARLSPGCFKKKRKFPLLPVAQQAPPNSSFGLWVFIAMVSRFVSP